MRLTASLFIILFLFSLVLAFAAGLVIESFELHRLVESARRSNCVTVESDFSHLRFVGYNLALLIAAIAAMAYAVFLLIAFVLRKLVELVFWRSA